jgi:hypothetical protein
MFRGERPNSLHFSIKNVEYNHFFCKIGRFCLKQVSMKPLNNSEDTKFKIVVKQANKTIFEELIIPNDVINRTQEFDYHEKDPQTMEIKLDVIFKEKMGSKILNVLKFGQTHNSSSDLHFSNLSTNIFFINP